MSLTASAKELTDEEYLKTIPDVIQIKKETLMEMVVYIKQLQKDNSSLEQQRDYWFLKYKTEKKKNEPTY